MNPFFANGYYQLLKDAQGRLRIADRSGKLLIREVTYLLRMSSGEPFSGFSHQQWSSEDSAVRLTCYSPEVEWDLLLSFDSTSPLLQLETETRYLTDSEVDQESVVFTFCEPVTEIFRKNRQRHTRWFQNDYWLDKQGVRFGSGERCALIYHAPEVSSLYLQVKPRKLWVNLDDRRDHPHLHPHPKKAWVDHSASHYLAGQSHQRRWAFHLGDQPSLLLRLMLHPQGYQASYVWTEHACFADLRLHKAVYFGSEEIDQPEKATGGFVKFQIPVTKSVFYANSQKVGNDSQSDRFTGPMVSIKDSSPFFRYLKVLHELGRYEICLHCPQPESSSLGETEEALAFMKEQFDAVSWIDHLWFKAEGKTSGCLECFSAKGVERGATDLRALWGKYGTRYFWNCCFEYLPRGRKPFLKNLRQGKLWECLQGVGQRIARRLRPRTSILDLFTNYEYSDRIPTPLYWRHPTRYPDLMAWPTRKAYHMTPQDNRHTPAELERLLQHWGVCFLHAYPAYVGESNGCWTSDATGKAIASPRFNELLQSLATLRSENRLNLSTVRELLDYWQMLERVTLLYEREEVRVTNRNKEAIRGFSLVANSPTIYVDGKVPFMRKVGAETIFWWDLPAGATARITTRR